MAFRKRKREANFTEDDVRILLECIDKYSDILNDTSSTGSATVKRYKSWEAITASYNSSETSAKKTITQLRTKYKNIKRSKKEAGKEKRKANRSSPFLDDYSSDEFESSENFIVSLPSRFDSDILTEVKDELSDDDDGEVSSYLDERAYKLSPTEPLRKNTKTKMKMSSAKSLVNSPELLKHKIEGMMLDNKLKKLDIENKTLDIEHKKALLDKIHLEMEKIQLEIESKKLDMDKRKLLTTSWKDPLD